MGSLPCHGTLLFYADADPRKLGTHPYQGASGETREGTVHTLHGGFVIFARLRKTADWTAYHQVRFENALRNALAMHRAAQRGEVISRLSFNYPAWWRTMSKTERDKVIDELSIRLTQRSTSA